MAKSNEYDILKDWTNLREAKFYLFIFYDFICWSILSKSSSLCFTYILHFAELNFIRLTELTLAKWKCRDSV